jgi:hypothetical protein
MFAVGIGLKTWKVTRLLKRQVRSSAWGLQRFRAGLERNWQRSQSLR